MERLADQTLTADKQTAVLCNRVELVRTWFITKLSAQASMLIAAQPVGGATKKSTTALSRPSTTSLRPGPCDQLPPNTSEKVVTLRTSRLGSIDNVKLESAPRVEKLTNSKWRQKQFSMFGYYHPKTKNQFTNKYGLNPHP